MQAPPEFLGKARFRQIGDMRRHPRHRQPGIRSLAAIIIAALPVRIGHDRLSSDFLKGDVLRGHGRRSRDAQHAARYFWPVRSEAQPLHSTHRAANDSIEAVDPQRLQQRNLRADHVADGDDREAHRIGRAVRRRTARPGRAHAAAQHIGADDEEAVGIDRQARPDHAVPPAGLAGDRMRAGDMLVAAGRVADQNGVVARRAQRAIGLIGNLHELEALPAVERQRHCESQNLAGSGDRGSGHGRCDLGDTRCSVNSSRCRLCAAAP